MANAISTILQTIGIFVLFAFLSVSPFVALYAWLTYAVPAIH